MENLQYSKIIKKNWEIVALVIGITVAIALVISLIQPFQYSATTKILIIQKQETNLDAYTATKSAERIAKNLASIIDTSLFYNEVIESNSNIKNRFPQDGTERRKEWKTNIQATVIPETGILEIEVYDTDRTYASLLVKSIAYVLVNTGSEYHGGGADVESKIVDDVFISRYPVRPNIILNTSLAVILGLVLGIILVILNEAHKLGRYNAEVSPRREENYLDQPERFTEVNFNPTDNIQLSKEAGYSGSKNVAIKTMYDHLG